MGRMKDILIAEAQNSKPIYLQEAIIETYAEPIDTDLEFYTWAKKQPFDIDDNNYEDLFEIFVEGKIKNNQWVECRGNYYHHLDVKYANDCYLIDKKNKIEDPYGELEF